MSFNQQIIGKYYERQAYQRTVAVPQTPRNFRIFISSTFSDLVAERNALQARVFPRLRELCHEWVLLVVR